ncbi:MAG TPA: NlpC/P60 family protein [Rhodanobacter sp.]
MTAFSVLAAALFVVAPVQATASKTHSKPAHAKQAPHKPASSKSAHHKPTHGKLASAAHKTVHHHSAAADTTVADTDVADTAEMTPAPPVSHLLQANAFATTAAPAGVDAAPAWLSQAPVFNPVQLLAQSTQPTYFGSLAAASDRRVADVDAVVTARSGQASDTAGAENVTDLRKALITLAMNLRDIRYVRGGRDPSTGFDCSGFVRYVFAHAIGLQLPTNSASQFLAGLKVNRADMKPGDLVFFRTHGKRNISHVGIYISEGHFIHSPATGKSVEISSLNDAYWAKRFAGAKRPEGIAQVVHNG